jgi:hypothetical protein
MARNQVAPMGNVGVTGRRTQIAPAGSQDNNPASSPASKSSQNTPNLVQPNQTRSRGMNKTAKK